MRLFLTAIAVFVSLAISHGAFAETLTLGSVNDNVRKHVKRFTPLANYLAKHLANDGITKVEIVVLNSSAEMADALAEGRVDLYFDSPLVASRVADNAGAVPFLRRWKRGIAEYHSIVIVPTESSIQSVDDLIGRTIGFQEPDSTSGFLLPAALLLRHGLELRDMKSADTASPKDAVGYVFTGDDENTILWLAKGLIDAGATDPRGFAILNKARPGKFRAIATSVDVPRQIVIRRGDLPDHLSLQIKTVLEEMTETDEGVAAMKKFHKTTKFDDFPLGVEATFAPIREILEELGNLGTS